MLWRDYTFIEGGNWGSQGRGQGYTGECGECCWGKWVFEEGTIGQDWHFG